MTVRRVPERHGRVAMFIPVGVGANVVASRRSAFKCCNGQRRRRRGGRYYHRYNYLELGFFFDYASISVFNALLGRFDGPHTHCQARFLYRILLGA